MISEDTCTAKSFSGLSMSLSVLRCELVAGQLFRDLVFHTILEVAILKVTFSNPPSQYDASASGCSDPAICVDIT